MSIFIKILLKLQNTDVTTLLNRLMSNCDYIVTDTIFQNESLNVCDHVHTETATTQSPGNGFYEYKQ